MINEPLPGVIETNDPELDIVSKYLLTVDEDGSRMAGVIRRTFDMLLDGQHTGRFRWEQLHKTEKTHCGTLIEINLQREFSFGEGQILDYTIDGIEIDCKYSQRLADWMVPPEAVGRLVLGLWASDRAGRWSAGIVRASEEYLNSGVNRDAKRTLNRKGRAAIRWLFKDAALLENVLLRLSEADIDAIFGPASGQARVNELFRRVQRRLISRTVIATVAMQQDYMKRARENGGARTLLQNEGIVVFGQSKSHAKLATILGLPTPGPGEFVSARLARRAAHHGSAPYLEIDGELWVIAQANDPVEIAPILPKSKRTLR